MPNKCIVPGCNTGYASCRAKFSIFSAPKNNELREEWQKSIRLTKPLLTKHVVCEKHFRGDLIIRSYKHKDESGNVLAEVPLKCARLVMNAIPTIFPLQKSVLPQHESSSEENLKGNENITGKQLNTVQASHTLTKISENGQNQRNEMCLSSIVESFAMPTMKNDPEINVCTDTENRTAVITQETTILHEHNLFIELLENPSVIKTPANWYFATPSSKNYIALYELYWKDDDDVMFPIMRRSMIIDADMKTRCLANGKRVNPLVFSFPDKFDSLADINKTLEKFASLNICCGISMLDDINLITEKIGYTDNLNQLRHNRCPIITDKRQCDACRNVKKYISYKKRRQKMTLKHQTLQNMWKNKLYRQQNALKRAKKRIEILRSRILSQQAQINELKEENVFKKCEELNISDKQKMCVKEIMATAQKKNSKGRRYTEEWVMLCILMHIQSPSAYEFLRKNEVLPIPSIRTIRRYLSVMNITSNTD